VQFRRIGSSESKQKAYQWPESGLHSLSTKNIDLPAFHKQSRHEIVERTANKSLSGERTQTGMAAANSGQPDSRSESQAVSQAAKQRSRPKRRQTIESKANTRDVAAQGAHHADARVGDSLLTQVLPIEDTQQIRTASVTNWRRQLSSARTRKQEHRTEASSSHRTAAGAGSYQAAPNGADRAGQEIGFRKSVRKAGISTSVVKPAHG
jgi:hypothetical protein